MRAYSRLLCTVLLFSAAAVAWACAPGEERSGTNAAAPRAPAVDPNAATTPGMASPTAPSAPDAPTPNSTTAGDAAGTTGVPMPPPGPSDPAGATAAPTTGDGETVAGTTGTTTTTTTTTTTGNGTTSGPNPVSPAPSTEITVVGQIAFADETGVVDPGLLANAEVFLKGFPDKLVQTDATGAFELIVDVSGMGLLDGDAFTVFLWKTIGSRGDVGFKRLGAAKSITASIGETVDLQTVELTFTRDLRMSFQSSVGDAALGEAEHCKFDVEGIGSVLPSRFVGGIGKYVVDYLPAGTYHVVASCDDHAPLEADVPVAAATRLDEWTGYPSLGSPVVLTHL